MPKIFRDADKEDVEVLDITGTAANVMTRFQKACKDLTKEPVTKQAAVGGASGWLVGYISMKIGKAAATVVGGSLILMQLAVHQGYIQVDWRKVNKDLEKKAQHLKNQVQSQITGDTASEMADFTRQNVVLASSFAGGVLLGIATS